MPTQPAIMCILLACWRIGRPLSSERWGAALCGAQAYANLGVTCPTTKAFLLALAEEACVRESYQAVIQAGWALTVINALPEDMLRRVRARAGLPPVPPHAAQKSEGTAGCFLLAVLTHPWCSGLAGCGSAPC